MYDIAQKKELKSVMLSKYKINSFMKSVKWDLGTYK